MSELSYRRVGHKGADHIAPGNTLASFDAALAAGVDMIEFDVLPENRDGSGSLLLAHDYTVAATRTPITLEAGLDHFCTDAYDGVELDVDLKLAGYEERVLDALRERSLVGRALISTMEVESLPVIRRLEPAVRLGWSVPKTRRNYLANPLTKPLALAFGRYAQYAFPRQAARAVRERRVDAIMAHWAIVGPRLVDAVKGAGGDIYVWTVDDPALIARLEALGVTGIISNDPRLFLSRKGSDPLRDIEGLGT